MNRRESEWVITIAIVFALTVLSTFASYMVIPDIADETHTGQKILAFVHFCALGTFPIALLILAIGHMMGEK